MNAFTKHADDVLCVLGVCKETGLDAAQVEESRKTNGRNAFSKEKPESLLRRCLKASAEPMIILLILAAVITLGINIAETVAGKQANFLECAGIFVAIGLSVVITVVMEGRSAKAFEALSKIGDETQVRVIRDGEVRLIPQWEVVVGDILCVETGDKLPADGRLIESAGLMADESALTGESMPVAKNAALIYDDEGLPLAERANMCYGGCFITGGSGRLLVTAVGDSTEFGKIARELTLAKEDTTPLQEKMAKLGKRVTVLGASAAAAVFLIQTALFIMRGDVSLENIAHAFITSIVLIVAAVPEGLPTIVAVSLAVTIIKMSKQNALVKKMIACETVGCINVICSDKTGTLTQNRMTVTKISAEGRLIEPAELSQTELLTNFCVNSTADVHFEDGAVSFIGNPTECALLVAANRGGYDYRCLRQGAQVLHTYPFSSENKNMTTVLCTDEGPTAYSKGSPEKILSMCALTPGARKAAERDMFAYQEKACRVIAFAHRPLDGDPDFEEGRQEIESGLCYDGFVAITDPLRADVPDAVERCRRAGIDLKMLTGDNIVTATAIANELHLLDDGHIAVEAGTLDALSEEKLTELLPKIRVIARSTPIIKMRVVRALKAEGNVVAVTGDGINDAPAIKNADVGIAMGISGTEVSKEASDIVLLDDSFSTIAKAIQWGRGIYENFQRFIQFQLTVNLSSVVVVLASILAGFASPFTALQLLWINIIMDGPPALTLGLEPIRGNLMEQKPTARNAGIISKNMFSRILMIGLYISVLFMAQHRLGFLSGTAEQGPTILFTLFVVMHLFNAFNCREIGNESVFKRIAANKLMLLVFALTFGLQVLITQFGGSFFDTVPLSLVTWLEILGVGFTVVLAGELIKAVKRLLRRS